MGTDISRQITDIVTILSAIAALGTAAAGLVDVLKSPWGGISNFGYGIIKAALKPVMPALKAIKDVDPLDTLHANWINGVRENQQKAVAKSLIHLGLTPENAATLADNLGIDPGALEKVANSIRTGTPLTATDLNVLGRFDTMVGAILDAGYERGDQRYRNVAKLAAMAISVLLAVWASHLLSVDSWRAVLVGLLATPLAPVTKDLVSSIQAAANAVNAVKGKA